MSTQSHLLFTSTLLHLLRHIYPITSTSSHLPNHIYSTISTQSHLPCQSLYLLYKMCTSTVSHYMLLTSSHLQHHNHSITSKHFYHLITSFPPTPAFRLPRFQCSRVPKGQIFMIHGGRTLQPTALNTTQRIYYKHPDSAHAQMPCRTTPWLPEPPWGKKGEP